MANLFISQNLTPLKTSEEKRCYLKLKLAILIDKNTFIKQIEYINFSSQKPPTFTLQTNRIPKKNLEPLFVSKCRVVILKLNPA